MLITIPNKSLLSALLAVKPAVTTRTTLPVLNCCRIEAAKRIRVSATTLDLWCDAEADGQVDQPGVAIVSFARLLAAASQFGDGDTTISVKDRITTITNGKSRLVLPGVDAQEWPATPEQSFGKPMTADGLPEMLARLLPFVSSEESRYVICGVYLGEKCAVATNGRSLAKCDTDLTGLNVIIPTASAAAIGAMEGALTIRVCAGLIEARTDDLTITSKLIEGNYPNWKQVVPGDGKVRVTVDRKALIAAVQMAGIVGSVAAYDCIRLDIGRKSIAVTQKDKDMGESGSEVECRADGQLSIAFAPAYLLPALRAYEADEVVLNLSDEIAGLKIEQDGTTVVTMPTRIA